MSESGQKLKGSDRHIESALLLRAAEKRTSLIGSFGPTADVVASFNRRRRSRQLTPFNSVYINRLRKAFEMAGTNVCDMQAIPDAILNGT